MSNLESPSQPINPGINPENGLISRVPTTEELQKTYGAPVSEVALNTTEQETNPMRHSATSAGQPGPTTPWGPSTLTGHYKRVPDSDDLLVLISYGSDPMDPKGSWVSLSGIHEGKLKWRVPGFPGQIVSEYPA